MVPGPTCTHMLLNASQWQQHYPCYLCWQHTKYKLRHDNVNDCSNQLFSMFTVQYSMLYTTSSKPAQTQPSCCDSRCQGTKAAAAAAVLTSHPLPGKNCGTRYHTMLHCAVRLKSSLPISMRRFLLRCFTLLLRHAKKSTVIASSSGLRCAPAPQG